MGPHRVFPHPWLSSANRLTAVNGVAYTWDAAGHLLSDGTRAYTLRLCSGQAWDAAGRLVGVKGKTGKVQYTYNGDGVRVRQTVNGRATSYVQDVAASLRPELGEGLPVVLVERSGLRAAYHLYGLDLIGQERSSPVGPRPEWWYYHYDGLGSTRHLTDQRGREIARYRFYAFGQMRQDASRQAGHEWLFTGEQWDAAAGLYFLRAKNTTSGGHATSACLPATSKTHHEGVDARPLVA